MSEDKKDQIIIVNQTFKESITSDIFSVFTILTILYLSNKYIESYIVTNMFFLITLVIYISKPLRYKIMQIIPMDKDKFNRTKKYIEKLNKEKPIDNTLE